MKAPQDCTDMADIRAEIDRLDSALMGLLAQRAAYIDRAAQIKAGISMPARIDDRVGEVLANVARHAAAAGLDAGPYTDMWRILIEWSIAREEKTLGKKPPNDS
jgi:isochorismate pyruvate lyase